MNKMNMLRTLRFTLMFIATFLSGSALAQFQPGVTVAANVEAKAIIIGAGRSNSKASNLAESNLLAAYSALLEKGYLDNQIRFLGAQSYHSNVQENSIANVESAFSWAADASELFVYIAGQGNFNGVVLKDGVLTPQHLARLVDDVQPDIPNATTLLMDTHFSASWLSPLALPDSFFDSEGQALKNRIFISGTSASQVAYWLLEEVPGFGDYFWQEIARGETVGAAYTIASAAVNDFGVFQFPALDDNNNGIANENIIGADGDGLFVAEQKLGNDGFSVNRIPEIKDSISDVRVNNQKPVTIEVSRIDSDFPIASVQAFVFAPHTTGEVPDIYTLFMQKDDNGSYSSAFDNFSVGGQYSVVIIATDAQGQKSLPAQFNIVQTTFPDAYEVDDSLARARLYRPDVTGEEVHTLHDNEDRDWFFFDVRSENNEDDDRQLLHSVTVTDLAPGMDIFFYIRDENGNDIFGIEDQGQPGEEETATHILQPGRYYVEVAAFSTDPQLSPEELDRAYTFKIATDEGDGPGEVSGYIRNKSGNLIPSVSLETSLGVTASAGPWGNFRFIHPSGNHSINIDYENQSNQFEFTLRQSGVISLELIVEGEGCTIAASPPGSSTGEPGRDPDGNFSPPMPYDFDGDRLADVAVRRPSASIQYVKNTGDEKIQRITFGKNVGDIPVSGDFDGDSIADIAVRRPADQMWFVKNSSGIDPVACNADGITRLKFGLNVDDIPVPADYDGDGITDFAVRRASTQFWFVRNSSKVDPIDNNPDGITRIRFGNDENDIPVPADYDGDGKVDFAVRRPGNQSWYIRNSGGKDLISGNLDGITRKVFGRQANDLPVPADYDGDGRADIAVRRASSQTWFILNSNEKDLLTDHNDGISRLVFGRNQRDIPVPADYDGDGKADVAVRRPGTQFWYISNSTGTAKSSSNHIQRIKFGLQALDVPLSAPHWLKMKLAQGDFSLSVINSTSPDSSLRGTVKPLNK